MPFQEVNLSQQNSQKAIIRLVCDDFLICKTSGFDTNGDLAEIDIIVSKPVGLRTLDYFGKGDWERGEGVGAEQQRTGAATGSYSGVTGNINPIYIMDDEIYFTKKISDPLNSSTSVSQSYYDNSNNIDYYANLPGNSPIIYGDLTGTGVAKMADHFVDENRIGRTWDTGAGSVGGLNLSGFVEKCVAFCEGGETISGKVLFKSGCGSE